MARLVATAMLLSSLAVAPSANAQDSVPDDAVCRENALVTAYSSEEYSGRTTDGTSTVGAIAEGQWIAAASRSIPLDARLRVGDDLTYRVADRGLLDENGITADLLMATTWEARQWGARRVRVCWWMEN